MSAAQITTEELEDFKLKVVYVADKEVVKKKNKEALDQIRNLKVPGFRPGKASDFALKVRFKDRINQWVQAEMLSEANDDIVFETKIRPLGKPKVESLKLNGLDFKMEAVYNKKPDFELSEYKGLEVPKPHVTKTIDERIAEYTQNLRDKHSDVSPYGEEDFVQQGDTVTLEYELSNGEKDEGRLYEVGSKLYPEFDENLFGMTAGETREFDIEVNGERVSAKVTLHMGLKKSPCPLDQTLADRCGVKSIDEVTNSIKIIAENQDKAERNEKLQEQIKLQLLEKNKFDVPNWLVLQEAEFVAKQQGLVFAELNDEARDKVLEQARDNVRFTLIIDAIKKVEPEVELADQEALQGVRQNLAQRGVQDVEAVLNKSYKDGTLFGFVEKMKNDYVVQFLVDNAKVVE